MGSGAKPRISDETIRRMRDMKRSGTTQNDIAKEFGVCRETVYRLTNRKPSGRKSYQS